MPTLTKLGTATPRRRHKPAGPIAKTMASVRDKLERAAKHLQLLYTPSASTPGRGAAIAKAAIDLAERGRIADARMRIAVLDLAEAGWTSNKAIAEELGLFTIMQPIAATKKVKNIRTKAGSVLKTAASARHGLDRLRQADAAKHLQLLYTPIGTSLKPPPRRVAAVAPPARGAAFAKEDIDLAEKGRIPDARMRIAVLDLAEAGWTSNKNIAKELGLLTIMQAASATKKVKNIRMKAGAVLKTAARARDELDRLLYTAAAKHQTAAAKHLHLAYTPSAPGTSVQPPPGLAEKGHIADARMRIAVLDLVEAGWTDNKAIAEELGLFTIMLAASAAKKVKKIRAKAEAVLKTAASARDELDRLSQAAAAQPLQLPHPPSALGTSLQPD